MTIGRIPHLASAVLPAAGAFTTQPAYSIPHSVTKLTLWVTYQAGASGGKLRLQALFGDGVEEAPAPMSAGSSTVVQPAADAPLALGYYDGPVPANTSAPIEWEMGFDVPAGATTFRALVAELGETGTPGTCALVLTGAAPAGT